MANTKAIFVLALPDVGLDEVFQYRGLRKTGGTIATTEEGAVSSYLVRSTGNRVVAATIVDRLKQFGRLEDFAMRLDHPREYRFSDGKPMNRSEIYSDREIEICHFLTERYGGTPIEHLVTAKGILDEFESN
ncbi:MAG: hypothetical protein PHF67_02080 [Candidatus Nanoarchaeia archaeon]|nr:hypothetical protein [Candidatus Nanoarchaeia archaeon]